MELSLFLAALAAFSAPSNSVISFDQVHEHLFGHSVTEQVLDGSVDAKLIRNHSDRDGLHVKRYEANVQAVRWHCVQALHVLGLGEYVGECGELTVGRTRR